MMLSRSPNSMTSLSHHGCPPAFIGVAASNAMNAMMNSLQDHQRAAMITPPPPAFLSVVPRTISSLSQSNDDASMVSEGDSPKIIPNNKSLRWTLGLKEATSMLYQRNIQPQVVGHRGALYETLENTREGFVKCANDFQCDAVELDVFLLPLDNTLVVFHGSGDDANPGLLTDYIANTEAAKPKIVDLTYDEVLRLQFNPGFAEFPCPPARITDPSIAYVPTLEQVLLDLKPTKCRVKIELKESPGVVKPVIELVERLGMQNQCSYSSFDMSQLRELRTLRPDKQMYPSGALFDGVPPENFIQMAEEVGATEIHIKYDTCTVDRINAIHAAGFGSMAWLRGPVGMFEDTRDNYWDVGNEDEFCYQALIDTGVQQICCNKPDLLRNMLLQQYRSTAIEKN